MRTGYQVLPSACTTLVATLACLAFCSMAPAQVDLEPVQMRIDSRDDPGEGLTPGVIARVANSAAATETVSAGQTTELYDGDPAAGGTSLGTVQTTLSLSPGEFEDVRIDLPPGFEFEDFEGFKVVLHVVVDPGETLAEMDENNNANFAYRVTEELNPWVSRQHRVLVICVNGSYNGDGNRLQGSVTLAGAAVTYQILSSHGQIVNLLDANEYDQVWVYDLSATGDGYTNDWAAIETWFEADATRDIICDGRIISGCWSHGGDWLTLEGNYIHDNYYENMRIRGGGLVLGTDHGGGSSPQNGTGGFVDGINSINDRIGIGRFWGNPGGSYAGMPLVDPNPLRNIPNNIAFDKGGGNLGVNSASSPGNVPTGFQEDDNTAPGVTPLHRTFFTLAWHNGSQGGGAATPAISTTIAGTLGFSVAIDGCRVAGQGVSNVLTAIVSSGAAPPLEYTWTSSIDGEVGDAETLDTAVLSAGLHTITLIVRDSTGFEPGAAEFVDIGGPDCNENCIPDFEDIADGTSEDCTGNGIPDECEPDCNENGIADSCDIDAGTSLDCQPDGVPDECQLEGNDCNENGIPDDCDILSGTSQDCQPDGIPDECQLFENDCNENGIPDDCDILSGLSEDCQPDGIPDDCQLEENDCNENGVPDDCDIAGEVSDDCNENGIPDECEMGPPLAHDCCTVGHGAGCNDVDIQTCVCDVDPYCCEGEWDEDCVALMQSLGCALCAVEGDCNLNGVLDECDIADGTSQDCNLNGIPDECDMNALDPDGNGEVSQDCNTNGIPDECDIADGTSIDCDSNGVPDECEVSAGTGIRLSQESSPGAGDFNENVLGFVVPFDSALSAADYYRYSLGHAASFNGQEPELTNERSHLFLVNNTDGLSLFVVHDKPNNSGGGRADTRYEIAGDPDGLWISVEDDPGEGYTGNPGDSVFTADHYWSSCCTDGLALTGIDGGDDGIWSLTMEFTAAVTSMDSWYYYSYVAGQDPELLELVMTPNRRVRLDVVFDPSPADCNGNGIPDACEIPPIGEGPDCNFNLIPDECEVPPLGEGPDCNEDGVPDECQLDGNDCNENGIPDDCDIASGESTDCNTDGIPDECQLDGNDCNENGVPDDCEPDSDGDTVPDDCDICPGFDDLVDSDEDGTPDGCDVCPYDPEDDADGDGVCGDVDLCPDTPEGEPVDADGCGCITQDDTPPVIEGCPGTYDIPVSEGCQAELPDLTALVEVTDNCDSGLEVVQDVPPGTELTVGVPVVVTITATDGVGLTDECVITVTLVDGNPPVFTQCDNVELAPVIVPGAECGVSIDVDTLIAVEDDCDADQAIECVRSDGLPCTEPFPCGATLVTVTATDQSGNSENCELTVTIDAVTEIALTVELAALDGVERCVTFELHRCDTQASDCGQPDPLVVDELLTFAGGVANSVLLVPCGRYECVLAYDPLHTLKRKIRPLPDDGTRYVAEFTVAGGTELLCGNLNGNSWIDVVDFGLLAGEWLECYDSDGDETPDGHTPCGVFDLHADLSGDGCVGGEDATLMQSNMLAQGNTLCCPVSTSDSSALAFDAPVTRISTAVLRNSAFRKAVAGDLNNDGWVDAQDMALWTRGVRPGQSGGGSGGNHQGTGSLGVTR